MGANIVRSTTSTIHLVRGGKILDRRHFLPWTTFDEHNTRSGTIIPCGGTLEAGDEGLEFNTSNVHGQYIIEVLVFLSLASSHPYVCEGHLPDPCGLRPCADN